MTPPQMPAGGSPSADNLTSALSQSFLGASGGGAGGRGAPSQPPSLTKNYSDNSALSQRRGSSRHASLTPARSQEFSLLRRLTFRMLYSSQSVSSRARISSSRRSRPDCISTRARMSMKAYPERYHVPSEHVEWSSKWDEYTPIDFTHKAVFDNDRDKKAGGWADPAGADIRERQGVG